VISVRVPILPKGSGPNSREHWAVKARRVKSERRAVQLMLAAKRKRPSLPATVTLTRFSAHLLDDDNAVGSMKAVRDEVARWLGVDDGDPRVSWRVWQRKCKRVEAGTLIQIEET
jgi:hypothetical protein